VSRLFFGAVGLAALVGCAVDEGTPVDEQWYEGGSAELGPELFGPSFMKSDRDDVYGMGCAYTPDQWLGAAGGVLDAHFEVSGLAGEYGSASAVRQVLAQGGDVADVLALRLSVGMNEAGVFGQYARLGGAFALQGRAAGVIASELPVAAVADVDAADSVRSVLDAFNQCPEDWYLAEDWDLDGDGIVIWEDCDDLNEHVG
jgi:hypothetical protein